MKKAKDVEDLASRLSSAAKAPLVQPVVSLPVAPAPAPALAPVAEEAPQEQEKATKKEPKKAGTASVFLRLPRDLFEKYDAEAVRRTKETGRGVSIQQVILEKLARAL